VIWEMLLYAQNWGRFKKAKAILAAFSEFMPTVVQPLSIVCLLRVSRRPAHYMRELREVILLSRPLPTDCMRNFIASGNSLDTSVRVG
jgi:hypothetical protein